MKFEYSKIMKLVGFSDQQIQYFKRNTGYGQLYSNYELAVNYNRTEVYKDIVIPVNQCNDVLLDKSQQNCFVIFQSDYLPKSFIQAINSKSGYVLVNSQWMKEVVISQTNCNPNKIIILPYLENFDKLNKYKRLKVEKNQNILTFYVIADNKDVKNLLSLIDAFDIAFKNNNSVQLIIKTLNGKILEQKLQKRTVKYPKITIINQVIPEIEIYKLHMKGDIYISTAYCVGWEIPPFQASYFGNLLICGNHSAYTQWVDFNSAIKLESYKKVIPLREYSSGRFKNKHSNGWMVNMIDKQEIVNKLLFAYENYNELRQKKQDLSKYSIQNIDYWIQLNNKYKENIT